MLRKTAWKIFMAARDRENWKTRAVRNFSVICNQEPVRHRFENPSR